MNLRAVVAGLVSAVNPAVPLSIQVNRGYTTGPDGGQVPVYAPPIVVFGDVQSMTAGDLRQTDGLNLQGIKRAIYVNGRVDGIVRPDKKGGDLVTTPDGKVWLVAMVLEYWPTWCKLAVTLQNQ